MKNSFLLLLFVCVTQHIWCQRLNYSYAYFHTNVATGVAAGENGHWLVAGYQGPFSVLPYVGVTSGGGEEMDVLTDFGLIFEDAGGELMNVSNVVYDTLSNNYSFIVARDGCDVNLSHKLFSITEEEGIIVGFEAVDLPNSSFIANYTLDAVPGQGVLFGRNSGYGGAKVSYWNGLTFWDLLPWDYDNVIRKISYWFNSRFVVLAESTLSLASFAEAVNGGEILQEVPFTDGVAVEPLNDSTLLVLSYGKLEVRDTNLAVLQELAFSGAGYLAIDESYVYVVAADGIHFLNHSLEELEVIALDEISDYHILDVSARDGRLGIAGASQLSYNFGGYSYVKPASSLFVKTYTIIGEDFPATTDLAITHMDHTTARVYHSPYDQGCMNATVDGVEVTIKNEGTTPISDVNFTYTNDSGDCGDFLCPIWNAYSWMVDVDLGPGQSTTVSLEPIYAHYIPTSSNFNFCIRAYATEGTTEFNLTNNRICSNSVVVGTDEVAVASELKVYPTVCQDQLTLSLPNDMDGFERAVVYNLLGQPVFYHSLMPGQVSIPLKVSQLASGSYYLRLEGEAVSQTVVFMKQ